MYMTRGFKFGRFNSIIVCAFLVIVQYPVALSDAYSVDNKKIAHVEQEDILKDDRSGATLERHKVILDRVAETRDLERYEAKIEEYLTYWINKELHLHVLRIGTYACASLHTVNFTEKQPEARLKSVEVAVRVLSVITKNTSYEPPSEMQELILFAMDDLDALEVPDELQKVRIKTLISFCSWVDSHIAEGFDPRHATSPSPPMLPAGFSGVVGTPPSKFPPSPERDQYQREWDTYQADIAKYNRSVAFTNLRKTLFPHVLTFLVGQFSQNYADIDAAKEAISKFEIDHDLEMELLEHLKVEYASS
ncbi:MAG: hypothetical protein GVY24_03620 [Planctomycetes bacterium]|jgi:hypothetical protein|nr:hypothetical protein [Planctomycetota bacterium]